jgi:hypothetical protein
MKLDKFLSHFRCMKINIKASVIFIVPIIVVFAVHAVGDETDAPKTEAEVSMMPSAANSLSATEKWEIISKSAKGIFVAKIETESRCRIVFFPGGNLHVRSSFLTGKPEPFGFDSVDAAAQFLRDNPPSADLKPLTSSMVVGDSSVVIPFTDDEKQKLGIEDGSSAPRTPRGPMPKEFCAKKVESPIFDWVKRGSLYWLDKPDGGVLQYRSVNGGISIVSSDISKATELIRAEIEDEQEVLEFVHKRLTQVSVLMMGRRDSYVVNAPYVYRRTTLPADRWPKEVEPGALDASKELLKKYICAGKPVVMDGRWELELLVTDYTGCIERWNIDGDLYPFSIAKLDKTVVAEPGTIVPLPRGPARTPPKPENATPGG